MKRRARRQAADGRQLFETETRRRSLEVVTLACICLTAYVPQHAARDPFSVLEPAVTLTREDRDDLRAGRTVVRSLDTGNPSQLAVFIGGRVTTTPEQFIVDILESARLWKSPKVPSTGTFREPVRREDVAGMTLPADDVDALRHCRPGDCDVKLTAPEMARLREAIARAGAEWRAAAQHEFRAIVLERIAAYRRSGLGALRSFHDHRDPVDPAYVFSSLLAVSDAAAAVAPRLAAYFERFPDVPRPESSSEAMYWLETTHPPKRTIQAWHIAAQLQPRHTNPEVVVLSRQLFATHYVNGSVALTALVQDTGGQRYLLYVNRSAVDGLEGFLSGLRRFFVERRVHSGARTAFEHLTGRLTH
ncbi:MAG TPA: hypothetical protein VD833_01050 [Vicinamibacterales bacterium]|nr:hypothetical protein [Vicinamibacterales bacterium]